MLHIKAYHILFVLLILIYMIYGKEIKASIDIEDNEFAEFEKYDDEPLVKKSSILSESVISENVDAIKVDGKILNEEISDNQKTDDSKLDDITIENDTDEFTHLLDKDEFEGFDKEKFNGPKKDSSVGSESPASSKGDLKFANVPVHLTTNWEAFYVEMLMIGGLAVYFLNFVVGKSKNTRLANAWFESHKELLEREFHMVGDDGISKDVVSEGSLLKESEHIYSLWCSGRVCVEGMLVELKLVKRQDVISLLAKLLKPVWDTLHVKVTLDDVCEGDGFVCAVVQRKRAAQLVREYSDLSTFCPERKDASRYDLPDNFCILSEIGEATQSLLDHKVCAVLTRYEENIDYLHISDQYTGPKPQQESDQAVSLPKVKRVFVCSLKVGRKGVTSPADMHNLRPLFQMIFYLLEKMRKIKLSKEAKSKADKNRVRANETVEKLVHSQRQEAAQHRREEKLKAEKERLLMEEDPERARRLEARVDKAEAKRKGPKMKMMKVKGM